MVGPSLSEDDRERGMNRLKLGFVALVAASGGLIALQGGGSIEFVAGGLVAGALVGYGLLWYLFRIAKPMRPGGPDRP